jgi:hypothetical protein
VHEGKIFSVMFAYFGYHWMSLIWKNTTTVKKFVFKNCGNKNEKSTDE